MKNKGFTLMELIVAMAIGSIVLLMVSVMLVRGTSLFRTENDEVNMRNDYQVVRNQIDQILMEAKTLIIENRENGDIVIYTGAVNEATRKFETAEDKRTTERVITYVDGDDSIYISSEYSNENSEGNRICDIVDSFSISLDESSKREERNEAGQTITYYVNPVRVNVTLGLIQKKSVINSNFSVNLRNRLKNISVYYTTGDGQLLSGATNIERYKVK